MSIDPQQKLKVETRCLKKKTYTRTLHFKIDKVNETGYLSVKLKKTNKKPQTHSLRDNEALQQSGIISRTDLLLCVFRIVVGVGGFFIFSCFIMSL